MLPRKYRLNRNRDYVRLYRHGKTLTHGWLKVVYRPNRLACPRIGVVIPNAVVKRATARNRFKRQLRAAITAHLNSFPQDYDIVLVMKSIPSDASFSAIASSIKDSIARLHHPHP